MAYKDYFMGQMSSLRRKVYIENKDNNKIQILRRQFLTVKTQV